MNLTEEKQLSDRISQLLVTGLSIIPKDWALTPVKGNKACYRTSWQFESPLTHQDLIAEIESGRAKGYGIRTGVVSGGIVAIDADGHAAHDKITELSSGEPLPETVAFTSNKPGRCQYLFYVPQQYWDVIATKKIGTGVKEEDGKEQKLELRWDGCQSVLPPSVHPETGFYRWRKSPEEVAIAPAPMWLIEMMLKDSGKTGTPLINRQSQASENWNDIKWALSYLNALSPSRADDYDDWLAVGMALHSLNEDSLLLEWDDWSKMSPKYKVGACEKKWKSFKRQGVAIGTLAHMAKQDGWRNPFKNKCDFSYQKNISDRSKEKASVTGDSLGGGDSYKQERISITDTVTTVTAILESGFQEWIEIQKLEDLRIKSELSNREAFNALVKGIKSQFDEVQPEDEIRLRSLIDWHNAELDFHRVLPSMADDILHDARILNIEAIGIWQYLFPAVLSLAGKRASLDIGSHEIPAIAWTSLIAESGSGKTRAEKLVTSPLKQLQKQAREKFQAETEEWEEAIANWEKGDGRKPPRPVERKFLFDVATIQAIMKRQSEQGLNGSLWARDELVGLFQSFGQFNKGENEALSCLLAAWDGGGGQVDRVKQEDSYLIDSTRLSIAGGIQPGIFKKAFQDPDDAQGLQARFLFAAMKPQRPKRVKGYCRLSEKLPSLYHWLDALPEGKIKLSAETDRYYDKLYEAIGEQAINTSMPAIRAWMFKLPAQLLRIALGLHLIECYHDQNRPLWTLQKDTLERAVLFAQYYRSQFHIIQTTAADTDDISAILLQIWDKALTRHPDGISSRDAYREIKAIQCRAKDAGRPVGAYTIDLFYKLEQMGKGAVVKSGRQFKFIANLTPPPINPDIKEEEKHKNGDRVTVAETLDTSTVEVSPISELSPATEQVVTELETVVPEPELDRNDESILDLAEILAGADKASLREIRRTSGITPSMLNQASNRLSSAKQTEIRGWVEELDQENEDQKNGKAVGRKARVRNLKGEISNEAWQIVKWCDRNGIYTLENGDKSYPIELLLLEEM